MNLVKPGPPRIRAEICRQGGRLDEKQVQCRELRWPVTAQQRLWGPVATSADRLTTSADRRPSGAGTRAVSTTAQLQS